MLLFMLLIMKLFRKINDNRSDALDVQSVVGYRSDVSRSCGDRSDAGGVGPGRNDFLN